MLGLHLPPATDLVPKPQDGGLVGLEAWGRGPGESAKAVSSPSQVQVQVHFPDVWPWKMLPRVFEHQVPSLGKERTHGVPDPLEGFSCCRQCEHFLHCMLRVFFWVGFVKARFMHHKACERWVYNWMGFNC